MTKKLIVLLTRYSHIDAIEPPGNAYTRSFAFCPLPFIRKKLSHLAQQARVEAFFISLLN